MTVSILPTDIAKNIYLKLAFVLFLLFGFNSVWGQQTQTTLTTISASPFGVPANITRMRIELWGGGGAGGGVPNSNNVSAGGGAGGSYTRLPSIVTPGSNITFTVGTGGAGISNGTGGTGGTSTFNSITVLSAIGGLGGATSATRIGAAFTTGVTQNGGAGGTGTTGGGGNSGGGGGGAGSTGNGGNASVATGGTGGTGDAGGTGGAGGNGQNSPGFPITPIGLAAGGGGARNTNSGTAARGGGAGSAGQIRLTYYFYSLTGSTATSPICMGGSTTIGLTASATGLPTGNFTVTYNLSGANTVNGATALMTVGTAGTGSFTVASGFTSSGLTTVTITNLQSGDFGSNISTNNTAALTVNPAPTVTTSATATTCSGTGPNIALTASAPGSFAWTIGTITGSITGAGAGSGSTINQTLTNPDNAAAGTVQYLVTPTSTAGSCAGAAFAITVTVNPTPSVTTSATASICTGTGPNIPLTASAASSFAWTIGTITGSITGASAGSVSTINQSLTNFGNAAGTVQYLVIPTATTGSCAGAAFNITVTVNPVNTSSAASSSPTLCINTALTNITHTTTGATGIFGVSGLPNGVTAAWAGNSITISGTPTNSGTFNYTMTLSGGCGGSVQATGTIIVNNAPVGGGVYSGNTPICLNGSTGNMTLSGQVGSVIRWEKSLNSGSWINITNTTSTYTESPSQAGTWQYRALVGNGSCASVYSLPFSVVVSEELTIMLGANPIVCRGTTFTTMPYTATTGNPANWVITFDAAAITAGFSNNNGSFPTISINYSPTVAVGVYNATVRVITFWPVCTSISYPITVTVSNLATLGAAPAIPTLCVNTALTAVTRTTTGATGISNNGVPGANGLPAGVAASWAANIITISGTPTASGTFNYSIPLTGSCNTLSATGTIIVTPNNTAGAASLSPTLCINTVLTTITHITTRATGISNSGVAGANGLPAGVSATWASNTITITGTPIASGTFNYSISLTGGCGIVNATGTIIVTPNNTVGSASSSPTQCINTTLAVITHTTTTASGISNSGVAGANGLPAGVSATWASNSITISGTPIASGTFSYSIPLTGGCGIVNATGTIIVTPNNTVGSASSSPTLCINIALTAITHITTSATGISNSGVAGANGLPAGVAATWASNTITISGTPSASGTFNYSILLTGGCGSVNATGTITVTPINIVVAGPSITACQSLTPGAITLSGASVSGGATTGAWSIVSGTGTLSSTTQTALPATVTFLPDDNYTGTVIVRLTTNNPGSCTAATSDRNIVVNPKPVAIIAANHCVGSGLVRLSVNSFASYLWNNTGQTTQTIDVLTAGNYVVTVTDGNGCSATDTYTTGTELVTNGDFNAGNTGFTTAYVYTPNVAGNSELYPEGYYAVGNNANDYHNAFNGTDHTSGSGNFMIVNGTVTADQIVWSQNNIAVTPNTTYYFSAWGLTVVNGNNAILRFSINGTQVGSSANLPDGYTNPAGPFTWVRFFGTWNSGSATNANLSIVNLQLAAGGNDFGMDDISFSNLPPLTLATTPSSSISTVCANSPINLLANVAGGNYPLTYAWTGPNSFSSIQQNPIIANAAAANAGVYNLTVTDKYGCSASGSSTSVTILPAIANNTVSSAQSICTSTTPAALTGATPTGGTGTYTYLWQSSTTSASAGFATASGTSNGISYTPGSLTQTIWYRRMVTSGTCSDLSAVIQITVSPIIGGNSFTAAQTICSGSTPAAFTGSTPTGGNSSYSYLWESSTTSSSTGFGTATGTSNGINYSPAALTQNTWFRRTVTSGGCSSTSTVLLITISPVIGNHTVSAAQAICSGTTPASLTNSTPTGGSGTYSYVWESSTTSASAGFAAASGTNLLQNYNPPALSQTTWYRTIITSGGCTSVATAIAITVTATITTNTVTAAQTICTSTAPAALAGSTPTGGNGSYTYLWQSSTTSASAGFVTATGTSNGINYSPATLAQNTWFRRTVSSGLCSNVSATVQVTVTPVIGSNTVTAAQTICSGATPAAFTSSTPTGGNSSYTYLWESSTTSASTGFLTAAGTNNTISYTPAAITQTTWYRRTITSGGCSNTSTAVQVTVTPAIVSNTMSNSQSICSGGVPSALTGSAPTGGTGAYIYTWQSSTSSASAGFTTASGTSNAISYTPGTLSQTTWYRRMVTSGTCSNISAAIQVTVNPGGQWVGGSSGDWNTAGNWCGGIPTASTNVNIPAGTTVNIQSANAAANSVTITGTGSLVMTGTHNLTINAGGSFTNNGSFTASTSTGSVVFAGSGSITGTTTFQNIQTSGALNFGIASTVNGNFTLQTGGSVAGNAPTYVCPGSILIYRTGGTFSRGIEWAINPAGQGYPSNVTVQSNTIINFPIPGQGYICNDLMIEDGSALNQNFASGSAGLLVGRNITIAGTLTLGGSAGGDVNIGGNWTRTSTGVFNHNDRRVTFDGTGNFSGRGLAMSSISAPGSILKNNEGGFGGENFAHLWINKTNATDSVVLLSNITVTRELGFTRGTFSLRNSDVTIVSNSTRTADIAPITTIANISIRYAGTGKFVVQRFIQNPTATRSWRLLTAPLQSATAPSINAAFMQGVVNPNKNAPNASGGIYNPSPGYGTHITGPGGTYSAVTGFDQGTTSSSILYGASGILSWLTPTSTLSTKVTDQQGWMLFVRGDRSFVIGNQYIPSANTILEPKGRINIGNIAVPVTTGRQVIGNPYASAISLLNVDVSGIFGKLSSYHVWDPKMFTSFTQPGKWVSFTGLGSTFVQTTSASSYLSNGTIESGQAFLMDVVAPGTITFHESDKLPLTSSLVGIANGTSARPLENPVFPIFRSDIYAKTDSAYRLTDGVLNVFNSSFNNAATNEDAKKMISFNTKESLSILRDAVKIAIEKRTDIQDTDTIFFAMSKFNELPYRFRFQASDFAPGYEALLEDKFTGDRLQLSTAGVSEIDFAITANPLSKAEDRFRVVFKSPVQTVLPVTFTSVKAWQQNKKIAVEWQVANEINIKEYEVEKSVDGIHFTKVNTTLSQGSFAGTHIYNWLDENAVAGDNFYRIKSNGNNEKSGYSELVKVRIANSSGSINVYPNPVADGLIRLHFKDMAKGNYSLRLLTASGQTMTRTTFVNAGAVQIKEIQLAKGVAKGIYEIEVVHPGNIKSFVKVIVE